jgi:serralysin
LSGFENLWGSKFADALTGNRFANTLTGDAGKDFLRGGLGNDALRGGLGGDTLSGGRGEDSLGGGGGADTFLFTALNQSGPTVATSDRITDLTGADLIDLSDIDANGAGFGNGTFVRIGNSATFASAGQLRLSFSGGDTRLQLNTDSDSAAEFTVLLTGNHAGVTAEDDWLL